MECIRSACKGSQPSRLRVPCQRARARMQTAHRIALTEAQSLADLAAVRDLFREYATWLNFSLAYQNFEEELASLPGKYATPQGRLFLASVGDVVAGCAALRPLERSMCEMKRLYVRAGFHGLGIGRALAQRLIEESRTMGYSHIRLDTIADKMPEAIALYRSLGFQEIAAYYAGARPGTLFFELRLRA